MAGEAEPGAGRRAPDGFGAGLIRAKLAPNRLPRGSVRRPQLLDELRRGRGRALTLVCAPAGFGKTTLLTEWAGTDAATVFAWVTLDPGDVEPVRLWTHVIAAIAQHESAVGGRSLDALRSNPDRVADAAVPVLIDELAEGTGDLVVILDDFHRAETAEINAQVIVFLRYRPPRVQLVVATRSDPALGVARLRASGDLVEVRAESLRFDDTELSRFFSGVGVTGLSALEQRRLSERTGGWPAPLRLAALLMPAQDRGPFIESFTGASRPVVDYLTREVLGALEPPVREFLLQVSVLGRLNGALCDAVTGMTGSGALLADLERSSVFISVDSAGQWYEQHQLFAEALRLDLSRARPDLVPVLHGRAARWLEAAGDRETATEHAIAARDVAAASRLIAGQVQVMAASGRWAAIRRWLSQLSWPEAMQDPELAYVRACLAALDNRIDEAVEWVAVARTGPPDQKDAEGLPLGFRADFAEASVGVNNVSRAEAAAQRAVMTAPTAGWEGIVLAGLGQAQYLQGRTGEAVATLRRAVGQIPDANPIVLAFGVANLALAEASLGVPSRADPMLDRLLGVLGGAGADRSPFGAIMQLACGERERRRGNLRGAAHRFQLAIEILGTAPRSGWLANGYVLLAATQRLLGDTAEALLCLDRADEILDRLPDPGALPARSAGLRQMLAAPHHHATEFGEQLSDREIAVLGLLAEGLSQRQIAGQLFISHNTVKSHLKTAYRKLGVASREDAIDQLAALEARTTVPAQSGEPPG
ncbi:MAG: LuxR C-terminal-related transcriptional regulator [Streptosporangiaceae bacterium]